ncbi:hypothetical protein G7046_g3911 [Stylonectria norvegica]|nr:hypothetical protein G7046_g3911 [Stylonectria norvegica]
MFRLTLVLGLLGATLAGADIHNSYDSYNNYNNNNNNNKNNNTSIGTGVSISTSTSIGASISANISASISTSPVHHYNGRDTTETSTKYIKLVTVTESGVEGASTTTSNAVETPSVALMSPEDEQIYKALFQTPLDMDMYKARDFNWIRCRTGHSEIFDAGGRWVEDWGEAYITQLKKVRKGKLCRPLQWKFTYDNGEGWGDAKMSFRWFWISCTIKHAVLAAIDVGERYASAHGREFYVYGCIGFEGDHWFVSKERASIKPKKDLKIPDKVPE